MPAYGPGDDYSTATIWNCRQDGCPMTVAGACDREGAHCSDDFNEMCTQDHVCEGGTWRALGQQTCRPAAPPQP